MAGNNRTHVENMKIYIKWGCDLHEIFSICDKTKKKFMDPNQKLIMSMRFCVAFLVNNSARDAIRGWKNNSVVVFVAPFGQKTFSVR